MSAGAAPLPSGVRDAALELANCLVRCLSLTKPHLSRLQNLSIRAYPRLW